MATTPVPPTAGVNAAIAAIGAPLVAAPAAPAQGRKQLPRATEWERTVDSLWPITGQNVGTIVSIVESNTMEAARKMWIEWMIPHLQKKNVDYRLGLGYRIITFIEMTHFVAEGELARLLMQAQTIEAVAQVIPGYIEVVLQKTAHHEQRESATTRYAEILRQAVQGIAPSSIGDLYQKVIAELFAPHATKAAFQLLNSDRLPPPPVVDLIASYSDPIGEPFILKERIVSCTVDKPTLIAEFLKYGISEARSAAMANLLCEQRFRRVFRELISPPEKISFSLSWDAIITHITVSEQTRLATARSRARTYRDFAASDKPITSEALIHSEK